MGLNFNKHISLHHVILLKQKEDVNRENGKDHPSTSRCREQYFPSARIEVVEFSNEDGTDFVEKVFTGPLIDALRSSLQYIKNMYVKEKVHKVDDKAEAERWFNYPYSAIEEALVNAVYHRSYRENASVEVRIYPSRIEIISYPGPMPPLNNKNIGKISCRRYRNSRIGDFLKEVHLTEGKSTGIPKIQKALKNNGSPEAVFHTDGTACSFKCKWEQAMPVPYNIKIRAFNGFSDRV